MTSATAFEGIEDWEQQFLDELEAVHIAGNPGVSTSFPDYAAALAELTPTQLLQTLDQWIELQPYKGSMVEPTAALMGRQANGLDRARLLAALLALTGQESRVMGVAADPGEAEVDYLQGPRTAREPLSPDLLSSLEWQVQTFSPVLWTALCGVPGACEKWLQKTPGVTLPEQIYWVQISDAGRWIDLVPADTSLGDLALTRGRPLTREALLEQTWKIGVSIINQFAGGKADEVVLEFEAPAGSLNALGISYDNVPIDGGRNYQPKLTVGDSPPIAGSPFSTVNAGQSLVRQSIRIESSRAGERHGFTRVLAKPMPAPEGLALVSRARLTVVTSPGWARQLDEQYQRTMNRLANLLFAEGEDRDDRPLNPISFRAVGLLGLSHRLAGQVGLAAGHVASFRARPALTLELDYPLDSDGGILLGTLFDLVDPGHGTWCSDCSGSLRSRAAVEQAVLDGVLEDWIMSAEGALTSHRLGREFLASGASLSEHKPAKGSWDDRHDGDLSAYLVGQSSGQLVGWRLDPGPQAIPILSGGIGGAISSATGSATSAFIRNFIKHATSKCGASDIGGSVILALAGAPMTGPLLSGIVGHMCRVAEAYNKASNVLNCLEFMGNDCSAEKAAQDLENMLKGLGDALATDLALAQAMDILVGAAIEGVIAPGVRSFLRNRWARTPRARMPPPRDSLMPPGRSNMPPPGRSVMPPGRSVMPAPGSSVMPPGKSVMPPREPPIPARQAADDDWVPDEFIEEVLEEVDGGVPAIIGDSGRPVTPLRPGQSVNKNPGTVVRKTENGEEVVNLISRQDHIYADDVTYHMTQMSEQGSNYNWGTNAFDRIKVDPETGLVLDGHHRVYAAERLGRPIPDEAIEWTPSTGAIDPAPKVDVRPGSKPRSEAKYPDRSDDPNDFQFDDLGDP